MTYKTAFNDFDYDLPEVPGLQDDSWKNDTCPVLRDRRGTIELWCDYADPAKREISETPRYSLVIGDDAAAYMGDSLDAALCTLAKHQLDRAVLAVPADLLNAILDMRCREAEALPVGKLSHADVVAIADKLAAEIGDLSVALDDEQTAIWGRPFGPLDDRGDEGGMSEADTAMWNAAWSLAKSKGFRA